MVNSNARVLVQDELRQEVVPGVAVVAHQGSAIVSKHMGSIDSDSDAAVS